VTPVYCGETAAANITQFHGKVANRLNFWPAKFDDKIRKGCPRLEARTMVMWFSTSLRCYIVETVTDRDCATINHKNEVIAFRLEQKSMTVSDLK